MKNLKFPRKILKKMKEIKTKGIIKFVPLSEYKEYLSKAKEISPDPNDVDIFALALKLNCPIWSNDKELKKQNVIKFTQQKN